MIYLNMIVFDRRKSDRFENSYNVKLDGEDMFLFTRLNMRYNFPARFKWFHDNLRLEERLIGGIPTSCSHVDIGETVTEIVNSIMSKTIALSREIIENLTIRKSVLGKDRYYKHFDSLTIDMRHKENDLLFMLVTFVSLSNDCVSVIKRLAEITNCEE